MKDQLLFTGIVLHLIGLILLISSAILGKVNFEELLLFTLGSLIFTIVIVFIWKFDYYDAEDNKGEQK